MGKPTKKAPDQAAAATGMSATDQKKEPNKYTFSGGLQK